MHVPICATFFCSAALIFPWAFLRFLAVHGVLRPGLETQLDTPRCYRGEQLPRALPWRTVRAFLRAIDRTSQLGLRDYTMFFLVATYGLRSSEIVALTLDDVDWRGSRLRVPAGKTGTPRLLPLAEMEDSAAKPSRTRAIRIAEIPGQRSKVIAAAGA